MSDQQRFLKIATRLLAKTRQGDIPWKKNDANSFYTDVPRSGVALSLISPPAEADLIRVLFLGKASEIAGVWEVHEGEEGWEILAELFEEARRNASGFDKVLDELEAFLKS